MTLPQRTPFPGLEKVLAWQCLQCLGPGCAGNIRSDFQRQRLQSTTLTKGIRPGPQIGNKPVRHSYENSVTKPFALSIVEG